MGPGIAMHCVLQQDYIPCRDHFLYQQYPSYYVLSESTGTLVEISMGEYMLIILIGHCYKSPQDHRFGAHPVKACQTGWNALFCFTSVNSIMNM